MQQTRQLIRQRKQRIHDCFVKALATNYQQQLFERLEITNYRIIGSPIIEPMHDHKVPRFPDPDLAFIYVNSQYNILIAGVKGKHTTRAIQELERQLDDLRVFISQDPKNYNLHSFFKGKVPIPVLQEAGVEIVGVYKTRRDFEVYSSEIIREPS